jgi:hypothetical protein
MIRIRFKESRATHSDGHGRVTPLSCFVAPVLNKDPVYDLVRPQVVVLIVLIFVLAAVEKSGLAFASSVRVRTCSYWVDGNNSLIFYVPPRASERASAAFVFAVIDKLERKSPRTIISRPQRSFSKSRRNSMGNARNIH